MNYRLIALLVAILIGYAIARVGARGGQSPPAEVLRAKRFELVDSGGKTRCVIETTKDDAAIVKLLDKRGNELASLSSSPDGNSLLHLAGPDGFPRASMGCDAAGDRTASLSLTDATGKSAVDIVTQQGKYTLKMRSSDGRSVLYSPTDGPKLILQRGKKSKTLTP